MAEDLSGRQIRGEDVTAATVGAGAGVAGADDVLELLAGHVLSRAVGVCDYPGGEEGDLGR